MNWYDLNYYEIYKIQDEELREKYKRKYFLYMNGISDPIIEELKKRGLIFKYSQNTRTLTIKQMAEELQLFYKEHQITQDEIYNAVGVKK